MPRATPAAPQSRAPAAELLEARHETRRDGALEIAQHLRLDLDEGCSSGMNSARMTNWRMRGSACSSAPASASTRGARVSDGVRVVATTRGAGRGVAATRNISVGELLVDVPLEKCVSVASARDDRELWRAIEGREMSVDVILAAHVLREAFGKRRRSAVLSLIHI